MFSVVIPTFESTQKILAPITSLNAQTFQDFEVIFADDRSPDFEQFEEVVALHAKFPYKIVQQAHHTNQVGGRILGIENATHQYICFLDHDDSWSPNKLQVVKSAIDGDPNRRRTIFYHQLECRYSDGRRFFYPARGISGNESVPEYLFFGNGMIQSSSMVFDKSIASIVTLDTTSPPHDDWDFSIEAAKNGIRFHYINQALAIWNVRRMAGVSTRDSSNVSLAWHLRKKDLFSRRASTAFLVNMVFPKLLAERRGRAAARLFVRQLCSAPVLTIISCQRLVVRTLIKVRAKQAVDPIKAPQA